MTTEKILKRLYNMAESLSEEDKEKFDIFMSREREFADACKKGSLSSKLSVFIFDLEEDFRKEEAKKSGKNNALKAAKNILKNAKNLSSLKQEFHYARDTEDGQFIADGYRMVLLKEADKLPLEPMPADVKAEFNYKRCIPNNFDGELNLPNLKALKNALKLKKIQYPRNSFFLYDFGKNFPAVNAEYLIDIMEIIKTDTCKYKGEYTPILLENPNGSIGLICPLRKNPNGSVNSDITAEDLK